MGELDALRALGVLAQQPGWCVPEVSDGGGVALEGEAKEQYNANQVRLSELSTQFSNNVLDATKAFELVLTDAADVAGLPPSARAAAA